MHVASAHVVRGQRVEAAACRPAHGHVGHGGGAAAQRVHRVAQQPRVKRAPAAMEVREAIDGNRYSDRRRGLCERAMPWLVSYA